MSSVEKFADDVLAGLARASGHDDAAHANCERTLSEESEADHIAQQE